PHNSHTPSGSAGERGVADESASVTAEDVALESLPPSRGEDGDETAPANETSGGGAAFSIGEGTRYAERHVQEEADARAAVASAPSEASSPALEAHAEAITESVTQTVAAAAVEEDEFSLDDLQSAIDEVLKEAEEKKATKAAASSTSPPP